MQELVVKYYRFLFIGLLCALFGLSFYVGYLQGQQQGNEAVVLSCADTVLADLSIPASNSSDTNVQTASATAFSTASTVSTTLKGKFVGSKNGTKYYLPTCGTVKRIKPENYIWFDSDADAQLQGYSKGKC